MKSSARKEVLPEKAVRLHARLADSASRYRFCTQRIERQQEIVVTLEIAGYDARVALRQLQLFHVSRRYYEERYHSILDQLHRLSTGAPWPRT